MRLGFFITLQGKYYGQKLMNKNKEQLLLLATFSALELNSLIPKLTKSDSNLCIGQSLVQTNQNTVKIRKSKRTLLFKLSEGLRMLTKMMMDGYMKMMEGSRYKLDNFSGSLVYSRAIARDPCFLYSKKRLLSCNRTSVRNSYVCKINMD